MKTKRLVILSGILFCATAMQAQVINFNVPGGIGYVNYSGQGALSDPGHNYWNAVAGNGATTGGLLSDGVTTSPITLTDAYGSGGGGIVTSDAQGANGTPAGLFTPYESDNTSTSETNTLNNVPPGIYNLYLYGNNGTADNSDRGTTFTVWTALTPAASLSTANLPADYDTFVPGVNYVVFSNIVVGGAGVIDIAWTANAAATNTINPQTQGVFNGLQLVPAPTAINPTEAASYNIESGGVGTESCSEGGLNVDNITNGSYLVFSNLDMNGVTSFQARVAGAAAGGSIAIHLGSATGTLIGTAQVPATGAWQTYTTVTTNVSGASGCANVYLVFTGGFNLEWFAFEQEANTTEAASYNSASGVQTEANSDGGGLDVDDISNGSYTVYNQVNLNGITSFQARVASAGAGGNIQICLDSPTGTVVGTCAVPVTGGWQTWTTVSCALNSSATGYHNVYLVYTGGAGYLFSIEWFAFQGQVNGIEAASYNGEYSIQTEANSEGGLDVGYIGNGSYLVVSNLDMNGVTGFQARVASDTSAGGSIAIYLDSANGTLIGTCGAPGTGGWQSWTTVNANVSGASGFHNVYLVFTAGFNLEWFSFQKQANATSSFIAGAGNGAWFAFQGQVNAIEAASYNSASGVGTESNGEGGVAGGLDVADINNGSYCVYSNLNLNGANSFLARVASAGTGGNIQIRLDSPTGTVVGTCPVPVTGGWQTWTTESCALNGSATGYHNVYLVFTGSGSGLFNVEWFAFSPNSGPPNFGPNVLIFSPSMSMSWIQSQLNTIFSEQQENQFGAQRNAYFFMPGVYSNLFVDVGYYTQVLGLGQLVGDVSITGAIESDGVLANDNATCNFWRCCENLTLVPTNNTTMTWAVSQGCGLRRVHIVGNLALANTISGAYSSGGFLADSVIDDTVSTITQQQWFSRNDTWGSWSGANWNMVFVGVSDPPSGTFPSPAFTTVADTPLIREKPYLSFTNGNYVVMVPTLETNSKGITWANGPTPGISIPISRFYLAQPGADNAASINAALASGLNLLLTPGIYNLTNSILVTQPDAIVFGLGYPTLIPAGGFPSMVISDVNGVKVGGIIFDAGTTSSPTLLEVATATSSLSHAADPIFLYDICARVGGAESGTAACCVTINANNVVGDNFWLWRADHGTGVGWTANVGNNGLIVNGNNVTMYGLAVEHYEQYQTLWNGNGGQVYFYQSELPYDASSQSAWSEAPGVNGYASYKVANTVTSHRAYGIGIYAVFESTSASCYNAIETPLTSVVTNGISMTDMINVWITGESGTQITHIINGIGNTVNSGNGTATLDSWVSSLAAPPASEPVFPAVHWEGDLLANLQSADLNAGSPVWTNRTSNSNGVGNFSAASDLNVSTLTWNAQSIKALYVDDLTNNALHSALKVPAEIIGNNPVSAEAWIYATAVSQQNSSAIAYGIQGGSSDPEADREFNYNTQSSGGVSGDFGTYDTPWVTTPAAGAWHYLAWTYNGSTVSLYLDGVLNTTGTPGSALVTPDTVLCVGAGLNITSNPNVDAFQGYIAAARVESGVLTPADIATNFALGLLSTAAAITPTGLTATAGDGEVVLNWNSPSNATGYNLARSTSISGSFAGIATNLNALSFTNTGLTDGTTYYFVVSATNLAGASSNSAPVSAEPLAPAPIFTQQPASLSLYPGQTAQFTTVASNAAAYQWRLTNATYPGGTVLANGGAISGASSNVLTLSGVASSNAGTYVVVATGPAGGTAISSNVTLAILATGSAMHITTSALDTAGQDWNTGSIWNPAGPAAMTAYEYPGSTYEVLSGGVLNTPNVAASTAFPGVDLQIDSGGELLLEHLSSISLAFPDLQLLSGGSLSDGADGTVTLTGELDIVNTSAPVTISTGVNAPTVQWVLNFDVPGGIGGVNYSGQAAYQDAVNHTNWNPIVPNGTTPPGTNSDGITTNPITLTEQQTSTGTDNPGSPGTPQGLEYLYANAGAALSTSVETCTLNNVPAGNYNLYLYGKDDDNDDADRGTTFTVNVGATSYGSLSTTNYYDTGFILYNDYVIFSNVFVPTAGTITFTYTANPNANGNHDPNDEGNFNGLQLLTMAPATIGPRSIQIASLLTGSGTINYSGSTNAANDLNIAGTGNTYSGQWNVAQGGLLGSGSNSLGTNNITIGANAALETTYNINNPNGSLTLNGQMYLYTADTFNTVTVNGVNMVPGRYTSTQLNTSYPTNFPTTWPVQMGSTTGTNTGLGGQITVLPTLTPPLFNFAVSGGQIQLSWPQANTGWSLQVQTNPPGMGISTNWVTVPASTLTNLMTFPAGLSNGSVFFRLVYP